MESSSRLIVAAACLVVLLIVAIGVVVFARGGEANRKYANKIMQLRVAAQAVAVALIVGLAWMAGD